MQHLGHRAPRLHPRGVIGMRRQPRLDIAAAFRRQLVVDVSMKLVFGDGNLGVGHISGLCPIYDQNLFMHNACHHFTRRNAVRSPSSDALTWARARASRDITVPIGTRLDVGDLAVAQPFQHHQQQHRALLFHQRRQRARDVAALGLGAAGVGIVVEQRHELRASCQRSPPVLVQIGQDGVEPAPDVAAEKQFFRAQRAHQRVLHQIVGDVGVARQRPRVAAQRRYHGFDTLAKRSHRHRSGLSGARAPYSNITPK